MGISYIVTQIMSGEKDKQKKFPLGIKISKSNKIIF